MWKANQCCGQEQFVAAQMNLKIKIFKKIKLKKRSTSGNDYGNEYVFFCYVELCNTLYTAIS